MSCLPVETTYQNHQVQRPAAQLLQRVHGLVIGRHHQALAQVNLLGRCASASLVLGALDGLQALLLLRQRRLKGGMGVLFLEAGGRQLVLCVCKERVAEVFGAELAHERQARRRKQRLLAHLGQVRHKGHGNKRRRRVVALQDHVQRFAIAEVRRERGQVCGKGRPRAVEQAHGLELFVGNGDEQAEKARRALELLELGDQLLRGCSGLAQVAGHRWWLERCTGDSRLHAGQLDGWLRNERNN